MYCCVARFSHLLFTESSVDSYAGSSFPGLSDTLTLIAQAERKADSGSQARVAELWEVARKHFSVLLYVIQSAQSVIRDVADFVVDY